MLEKLFESLDEKIFTAELKESLESTFNEAVEVKSQELIESKIQELEAKSDDHITMLEDKAEEYVELQKDTMLTQLDTYLERVVEEFLEESKTKLDESEKSEKADMVLEAFESMLIATGVKVADIVEAKDTSSVESKLDHIKTKYDELVEESIQLKEENIQLIKLGVISELGEGMSIIEKEKFEKLAELVEFTKDDTYATKLQTIIESVKGSTKTTEEPKLIAESKNSSVYSHLI